MRIITHTLAALCIAVALAGCGSGSAQDSKAPPTAAKDGNSKDAKSAGAPPPVSARVLTVSAQRVPIRIDSIGQIEGSKEVEVRARAGGTIEKWLYREGEMVKVGQPLFQIDPAPFQITLAQARAQLAQERARNEQARRESGRLKELASQKAISQREYDDATSNLKLSDASVQMAEAKVREAELNLSYTHVDAPVGGVSGRAQRSVGSLVGPSDVLTTISQISPVWVRFSLAEPEVVKLPGGRLPADADVRLVLGDDSRYPVRGRINFAASQIDLKLGTRQMRAEFDNPDGRLLPGQFVRVEIAVQRPQPVFLVPQPAVLQSEKGHFVFVVDAAGKAAVRPIQVGEWAGSDWVVLSGLNNGDRVVLDNIIKMQPGVTVRPVQDESKPGTGAPPGAPAGAPAGAAGASKS